eukprot:gene4643-8216_t
MKTTFKTPEGYYKLDFELKKSEKNVNKNTIPPKTFSLHQNIIQHAKTDSEIESKFLLSQNSSKKIYVYNLLHEQKNPVLSLDCSSGVITCHKYRTNYENRVEILIGFASGDLVLHSSLITKGDYRDSSITKLNKERSIDSKPVTSIAWSKDEQFLVSHSNGNIYLYNKSFTKESQITEKITSRYQVFHNKKSKTNPISKIAFHNECINHVIYSSNYEYISISTLSGELHILDSSFNQIIMFKSYFGGFLTSSWSLNDQYIVAGSEDDLVSIFSLKNECLIARGISGHEGNISSVIFDSYECKDDRYRIVSVGQDGIMSFWEIEDINELEENEEIINLLKAGNIKTQENGPILVPALSMDQVISFEPIVTRRIHNSPIGDILALEDYLVTVCSDNYVRFWLRPSHKSMKKQETKDEKQ